MRPWPAWPEPRGPTKSSSCCIATGRRDFRSIGHKAIFVANGQRALGLIGWRHAEPVLRSMAYALLMHEGDNPARRDSPADRPWRRNQALARQIRADWQDGKPDDAATAELLAVLRQGSDEAACDKTVQLLSRRIAPQSIWDALFCGAGELLLRQPGIVALHAVTTTNALHYAYQTSGDDLTRRLLLLQNAAFLPMFREAMKGRGPLRDATIDGLQPSTLATSGPKAVEEIFSELSRDRMAAVSKVLAYARANGSWEDLAGAARHLVLAQRQRPARLQVQRRRPWKTTTTCRLPGEIATRQRRCSSCAARATQTASLIRRVRALLQG